MSWRSSSYSNCFLKKRKLLQAVIIKPQIQWEVEPLICLGYCAFAFYNEIKAMSRALAEGSPVPYLCNWTIYRPKLYFSVNKIM